MITKEKKQELIEQYKINESDTGSPEVQIAILPGASRRSPSISRPTRRTTTPAAA